MPNHLLLWLTAGAIALSATGASAQKAQKKKPEATDSHTIYPARKNIYHKGWIDFNKNGKKDIYEDPTQPTEARVADLLSQMTLEEKSNQLATYYGYKKVLTDSMPTARWADMVLKDGIANIDEHLNREVKDHNRLAEALAEVQRFFVEHTRLGIPVDFTNEGIRGLVASGATSFPSMNGLGSTFDKEVAYAEGRIVGREARALGYTNVYAPILDVVRDQRWGRWDGTISEDPYLVARLGVEMSRGIQEERVVSSPKHFVGYGDCKGARQWDARTDPHITPSEMYYIHEYPFRKVFAEAGALGVMCCYADYDGTPIAASRHWLDEVLRGEMGFKGYVVSDSYAVGRLYGIHHVAESKKEAVRQCLEAGLNVRTDFTRPDEFIRYVRELVKEGKLDIKRVDELVGQVLSVKFWIGLFDQPYTGDQRKASAIVSCPEHLDMALRASRECVALLKNDKGMLPLGTRYKRIAVVGPNAHSRGYVSTHYGPTNYQAFSSLYDGLRRVYEGTDVSVEYAKGINLVCKGWPENELIPDTLTAAEQRMIAEAEALARRSDVVVLAVGDDVTTSGESRTRTSLDLPGHQQALVEAMVRTGKPVVLVLIWGRPATINYADRHCPAILAAGYPGAQGGRALAESIKGDYNPGGRLPGTWPRTVGQLPMNIPTKPNANYEPNNYTVGNKGLLYCFGHGLSYTTFAYDSLRIDSLNTATGQCLVRFRVTNTGSVAGDEVPQMYLNDAVSSTTTYEKLLRGFDRIHLKPGESRTLTFPIVPDDLTMFDREGHLVVEPGEFRVMIGASYDDIRLRTSFFVGTDDHRRAAEGNQSSKMMNDPDAQ